MSWFGSSDEKKLLEISKKLAPIIVNESFLNSRDIFVLLEYDMNQPEADINFLYLSIASVTMHVFLANIVAKNVLKKNKDLFFNNLVNETYEYLKNVVERKHGKFSIEYEKTFKNEFYDLTNRRREEYSRLELVDNSYLQNETVFGKFSEEALEFLKVEYNSFSIMIISEIVMTSIAVIGVNKLLRDF